MKDKKRKIGQKITLRGQDYIKSNKFNYYMEKKLDVLYNFIMIL